MPQPVNSRDVGVSPHLHAVETLNAFLTTPLSVRLAGSGSHSPETVALDLFRSVAETVPAYQQFLRDHQIDPSRINTPADFQTLPLLTKANYMQRYPLADRCRHGQLSQCDMMAVSSGSTGVPTFWPRFMTDELEIATRFEQVFHDSFRADERTTLAVVCFALGSWVGGMYTASCCRYLAAKGYPLMVVTPGNNKAEIFRIVTELGPEFEQVVLLGYPPFLKDVIDSGMAQGIDWSPFKLKLVTAGEVFSEEWRELMGERTGMKDLYFNSASLYGTADAGVLGNETPLSIVIRQFFAQNPLAARELFGESRLPTLVQYDPSSRYFETHEGTLLFSGNNGIPLIRYHIADTGGIVPYDRMLAFLADHGFDPKAALKQASADRGSVRGDWPLPFVYVFGRSNFTISYFGANIYPENVTVGLEQPPVKDWVTGKFVMQALEDADKNRVLSIVVELIPGVLADEAKADQIAESILTHVKRLNSEFAHYVPTEYQRPRVTLLPHGDPEYFPVGVKHRYTRA